MMPPSTMRAGLRACLTLLLLCLFASGVANAEALTPLRGSALPALPAAGTMHGFATVDGRLLAVVDDRAWVLDEGHGNWQAVAWSAGAAPRPLSTVFGDASRGYVLLVDDASAATSIARLSLDASGVALTPLPPLPGPVPVRVLRRPIPRSTSPASKTARRPCCVSTRPPPNPCG